MANLILTQSCDKNCSYCFARQFRFNDTNDKEMSLVTVKSIIDKLLIEIPSGGHLSLLGGEPTKYTYFKEALEMCNDSKIIVNLISNFLFPESILNILKDTINRKQDINFLINATELRENNRMEIFSKNYNEIYTLSPEDKVSCGVTLDGDILIPDKFTEYLKYLLDNLIAIDKMRISLNFPGDAKDKENFYFINNHELGDLIYHITKQCLSLGITPNIDCITYPCMYRTSKIKSFVMKYATSRPSFICENPPEDYLPDGSVRYCFPSLMISLNGNKYRSISGITATLRNKYVSLLKRIKQPEICQSCSFLKDKVCAGPCLGFRNLKELV